MKCKAVALSAILLSMALFTGCGDNSRKDTETVASVESEIMDTEKNEETLNTDTVGSKAVNKPSEPEADTAGTSAAVSSDDTNMGKCRGSE